MEGFTIFIVLLFMPTHSFCKNRQKHLLVEEPDVNQLQLDIQTMKAELASLKQTVQQLQSVSTGATYTRWGRADCRNVASLYSRLSRRCIGCMIEALGFAAGGHYDHYGSAAEYVCLPHNPDFHNGKQSTGVYNAYIYGTEYEDNVFGSNFRDEDVPCAVCIANAASNILMIPGKLNCNSGWKKEYYGMLASQSASLHAAGQYICIDDYAQTLEGGFENKDGKLVYPVHAACGSLRCPPYKNNELLTCVVCSK